MGLWNALFGDDKEDKYDLQIIARSTGHPVGCSCHWCGLGKASQDFKEASDTFDRMSWPFK